MTVTEVQVRGRGYAVMTKPGISAEADARARVASGIEGQFLRKVEPEYDDEELFVDGPFVWSWTQACPSCGSVHPS